jgi:hypothetical protein
MNVERTRAWREAVVRMLALAELDLRLAQSRHDGSERSRRRYARARVELEVWEQLAGRLVERG